MLRTLLLMIAWIAAAGAQAATFTDRSTFEAAMAESYVEDFQSLPTSIIGFRGPALLPSGLLVRSESNRLFVAKPGQSTNPTTAIGSNLPLRDSLYLDLGGEFSAFGADIFQNLQGGSQADFAMYYTLETFLGGRAVDRVIGLIGQHGGGFLGLTSTSRFDRVRVFSWVVDAYEVVDNVAVGAMVVAAVPLPTGLPLLAAALGSLGLLRRRGCPQGRFGSLRQPLGARRRIVEPPVPSRAALARQGHDAETAWAQVVQAKRGPRLVAARDLKGAAVAMAVRSRCFRDGSQAIWQP